MHATHKAAGANQCSANNSLQHKDNVEILRKNNFKFHILIGKAAGNPIFSIFMQSVMEILEQLSDGFAVLSTEQRFLESHLKIFRAFEVKDQDMVKRLVEQDILDVDKKLGAFLKKNKRKSIR